MELDANGTTTPESRVAFLGVEGEVPGSALYRKWQASYARLGNQLFLHGMFRVRDLANAALNYSLFDFGPTVRAGRNARRTIVFPHRFDKSIWVIDVDVATGMVLYSAEFDPQLRLQSEVEAISFAPQVQSWAAASIQQQAFPDFASADLYLGNPDGVVAPDTLVAPEYVLSRVEVRDDPLSGLSRMRISYTDGIDEFLVTQQPGASDVFANLPARNSDGSGHAIARYRDPTLSLLMFWEGGVGFEVAGRGALLRLDEIARRIYLQARSSN
jgi:hypothetical protein